MSISVGWNSQTFQFFFHKCTTDSKKPELARLRAALRTPVLPLWACVWARLLRGALNFLTWWSDLWLEAAAVVT